MSSIFVRSSLIIFSSLLLLWGPLSLLFWLFCLFLFSGEDLGRAYLDFLVMSPVTIFFAAPLAIYLHAKGIRELRAWFLTFCLLGLFLVLSAPTVAGWLNVSEEVSYLTNRAEELAGPSNTLFRVVLTVVFSIPITVVGTWALWVITGFLDNWFPNRVRT